MNDWWFLVGLNEMNSKLNFFSFWMHSSNYNNKKSTTNQNKFNHFWRLRLSYELRLLIAFAFHSFWPIQSPLRLFIRSTSILSCPHSNSFMEFIMHSFHSFLAAFWSFNLHYHSLNFNKLKIGSFNSILSLVSVEEIQQLLHSHAFPVSLFSLLLWF